MYTVIFAEYDLDGGAVTYTVETELYATQDEAIEVAKAALIDETTEALVYEGELGMGDLLLVGTAVLTYTPEFKFNDESTCSACAVRKEER
jgi:hypothetical protein